MPDELMEKRTDPVLRLGGKFEFQRRGLVVLGPERPSLEQYQECYGKLCAMQDAVQFWVGDLYNALERDYGEEAFQILEAYDYDRRSITNFARVARLVPIERRRPELEYAHHECVAKLPPKEQEQLLDEAVTRELNVRDLRRRVKEVRGETVKPPLGQELSRLIDTWRHHSHKSASECANELEKIVLTYGLA